jgi:small subunit ribosomal protein S11
MPTAPATKNKGTSKGKEAAKTKAAPAKAAKKTDATVLKRVKKARRAVSNGQAHILASYNNTIVTVTDLSGNTLGWASSGALGFKGAKKSTPYAAGQVVHNLMDRLEPVGLREVVVFVNGIGSGREAAIRAFQTRGVNVASIKDVTPIPHNGARARKMRRV